MASILGNPHVWRPAPMHFIILTCNNVHVHDTYDNLASNQPRFVSEIANVLNGSLSAQLSFTFSYKD